MDSDEKDMKKPSTPIADGDSRPDMPVTPEEGSKKREKPDDKNNEKKFESERMSDLNSLEDYKDAK